jgi:DNA-3-methyladenine glycosylase II
MSQIPTTPTYWQDGIAHLIAVDAPLKAIIEAHPKSILQSRMDCFHTLMRSITRQQISVQAADSIWRKLELIAPQVTPQNCANLTPEQLRSCGFSRQKISYIQNLLEFESAGHLKLPELQTMTDAELITYITQIKGIGKWSAEMFAIFCLMRPNILPLDDIGLQRAMSQQYGITSKPFDKAVALEIAHKWQPYCTIATWFLWRSIDPSEVSY